MRCSTIDWLSFIAVASEWAAFAVRWGIAEMLRRLTG
jgi:hypothetical protein